MAFLWGSKSRRFWFVCSNCMTTSGHDPLKSVFYFEGPGEDFLGRMMYKCPRCSSTNTRSFQDLKDEGSDAALFGLERLVKKYPRSTFEVKPQESPAAS
jgi:hypothetical protein